MTHFLVTEEKPEGYKLEEILKVIRKDVVLRMEKIIDDRRPEAEYVLNNNVRVLGLLSDAIRIAEDSSSVLNKAFGPSAIGGPPRIGRR